ncbi:probable E3 ubiquitin-protein ligase HERC1 [Nilaparvata lugens]|uniref:probable E3 ubiquitin-protein ligase HERC1 n=1 Tax=Nilaparvata lugens TaxID=108931 RepID=UPI00193C8873|nr:probable E3 ubiquitin-protein ligase HERC1 [Nilaparvata lugens]
METTSDQLALEELCQGGGWAALAVVGGVDRGLRVGGVALDKVTGRQVTVLGSSPTRHPSRQANAHIKVYWEDAGEGPAISDRAGCLLEPCEPTPFNINKLSRVPPTTWRSLACISNLARELAFPACQLSDDEAAAIKKAQDMTSSAAANQQPAPPNPPPTATPTVTSVESLTNQIIVNIFGEVTRRASIDTLLDNMITQEASTQQQSAGLGVSSTSHSNQTDGRDSVTLRMALDKLTKCEAQALRLVFLQFGALKTLSALLSCGQYAELLLVPCERPPDDKEEKVSCSDSMKSDTEAIDESELREAIRYTLKCFVDKSIESCQMPWITSLADLERGFSLLQSTHVARALEHRYRLGQMEELVRSLASNVSSTLNSSDQTSCELSRYFSLSRSDAAGAPFTTNNRQQLSGGACANASAQNTSAQLIGSRRGGRSPSPPPPLHLAAPLLEMGFTLKHVQKALRATGSHATVSASTINKLATWMIEHPCILDVACTSAPSHSTPDQKGAGVGGFETVTSSEVPRERQRRDIVPS